MSNYNSVISTAVRFYGREGKVASNIHNKHQRR
jgi:hypothetical protein